MHNKNKLSRSIPDAQARRLLAAMLYFISIGKWPNRFTTIHLKKGGVAERAHDFVAYFTKQARDWLRGRRVESFCFGYVFESVGELHVHIVMHIPIEHWDDFTIRQRRWLKRALKDSGGRNRPGVLCSEPVWYYKDFLEGTASQRDYLKRGLGGLLLYLLKGARSDNAVLMGVPQDEIEDIAENSRPSYQGVVTGRRVGASQNLTQASARALRPDPYASWLDDAEKAAEAWAKTRRT